MAASWSIRRRLFIGATLVVGLFLALTGIALDQAFRSSAEQARSDRLLARVYMIMGLAEVNEAAVLTLPDMLPDPDLAVPASGIYAGVSGFDGTALWQSDSSLNDAPAYPEVPEPGRMVLQEVTTETGALVATLNLPVIWEVAEDSEIGLIFHAGEDTQRVAAEVQAFRTTLSNWLGGAGIVLVALQFLLLAWITRPLNQVGRDLAKVEAGDIEQLGCEYPTELRQLTEPLNSLIRTNDTRLTRYRNALGDLAHSLKTPLASARVSLESGDAQTTAALEQLDQIDAIIERQLQRASTSGRTPLAKAVRVKSTIERVIASVQKVYADKALRFAVDIPESVEFRGDAGDLLEIAGNLCDNACKYARSQIVIRARNIESPQGTLLQLTIADDGPGIPPELSQAVTDRGVRADSINPGHGIGLALVKDMVDIYAGELIIGTAELGGAEVCIRI
jgi:two-component system sensor histidine kinase PhoQ